MELRPGYKQTEVGVIPDDWDVKSLGQLAELTSSKRIFESDYVSSGIPFYRGKEISLLVEDKVIEELCYISEARFTSIKAKFGAPARGDILITAVGTLANVYVVNSDEPFYFKDGNLIWLRNIKEADAAFLGIQMRRAKSAILDGAIGTSQKALTMVVLRDLRVAIAPPREQRAIATALGDLDALLGALDQLITKKREIKQAALQQLLTGRIRLSGFKGNWEVKRLGDIATIRDGTHQTPKYVESGIPFYSVEHVTSGDFANTKFISAAEHRSLTKSSKIEKGDILMTRIGSIGDCKLIDWDVDASFYVSLALLKINEGYHPPFIAHYSKSESFKKEVELHSLQSAIPKKINLGPISDVKIKLPPLSEQVAISSILTDMDAELSAFQKRREKTRALKQGMMQELLTGQTRLVAQGRSRA